MKINIILYSPVEATDTNVFLEIYMPFVPRVNDYIYLTHNERKILEDLIANDENKDAYSDYYYVDRYGIDDCNCVTAVYYDRATDKIFVELGTDTINNLENKE